jgi:hypothetical protein
MPLIGPDPARLLRMERSRRRRRQDRDRGGYEVAAVLPPNDAEYAVDERSFMRGYVVGLVLSAKKLLHVDQGQGARLDQRRPRSQCLH